MYGSEDDVDHGNHGDVRALCVERRVFNIYRQQCSNKLGSVYTCIVLLSTSSKFDMAFD